MGRRGAIASHQRVEFAQVEIKTKLPDTLILGYLKVETENKLNDKSCTKKCNFFFTISNLQNVTLFANIKQLSIYFISIQFGPNVFFILRKPLIGKLNNSCI